MNKTIEQMVSSYKEDSFFTFAAPSSQMLADVQEQLNVVLPEEYIDFLKAYGSGGIGGVEILGFNLDGSASFLDETFENRTFGLPQNFVVVENVDEWLYCIDCESGQVFSWNPEESLCFAFSSFDDFIISEFSDAIENL